MPSGGGEATQLSDDPAGDYAPAWGPAGELVVFQSNRRAGSRIWVVRSTGGPATQATDGGGGDDFVPDWHVPTG
jgi:tricorn protease